jgi:hypothetical protein
MPPMANGLVPKLEDSSTSSNQRFSSKLGLIPKARSRFSPTRDGVIVPCQKASYSLTRMRDHLPEQMERRSVVQWI